jgi:uncharacterized membrane protein YuzA (DUF378 family)
MEILHVTGIILAAVGALNWGLVALFNFDLVAKLTGAGEFGARNSLSRLIYVLVAAAGVISLMAIPSVN